MNPTSDRLDALRARIDESVARSEDHHAFLRLLRQREERTRSFEMARRFLEPHTEEFHSALRPVFLQQLRDTGFIDLFSPLLVRDGLLPLAHFFHRMAGSRPGARTLLLVNRRFAAFVPRDWDPAVAYYSSVPDPARLAPPPRDTREIHLVLSAIDERQCSFARIRERLGSLREALGDRIARVPIRVLVLFNTALAGDFCDVEYKGAYLAESLMQIRESLGVAVGTVGWNEVRERDLTGCGFIDLNEHDFYCSSSAVIERYLAAGAFPLDAGAVRDGDSFYLPVSLNHGYRIFAGVNPDSEGRGEVGRAFGFLETGLYREEERAFEGDPRAAFRNGAKFCPLSFETLIYSMAHRLRV